MITEIDHPLSDAEKESLDMLKRFIEHAPRKPTGPMNPEVLGWFVGRDRQWYVCANCAARIMERGCRLPEPANVVYIGEPAGVCCLC